MRKTNKDNKSTNEFKCTVRISIRTCCFINPRPASPLYQNLSPPTDYQTGPPPSPIMSPPLSPIVSPGELLCTPKSTPPPLTSPSLAPSQPYKQSSSLAINLDLVELIFSTPPISPHPFFDSLGDLPLQTTNPPPPRPSFDSIERLANQPLHLPTMEPPLLHFPPQLPPLGPNSPFPMLTHEMFKIIVNIRKSLSMIFVTKGGSSLITSSNASTSFPTTITLRLG
ncbi:hypothetical protein Tco_0869292 [Tanacetum coccineum]